jgi:Glycosyltransferase family 87
VRDRLLRDVYVVLAVVFVGLRLLAVQPWVESVDAYAYWATRDGDLYAAADAGVIGAYVYSPAFAQVLRPLVLLPWPVFCALWTAINAAVLWRLAGRLALPLLLFVPIPFEIVSGNVHLLIALACVVGFRAPWAWALPILTKVTPGIGLLWFVVRREWRALAIAAAATASVAVVSFVADPAAWLDWVVLLARDAGRPLDTPGWYLPVPLVVRLPLATAIVAWGAWTDRRWTIPVAVTLALPVVWLNSLAILAALPALWPAVGSEPRRGAREPASPPASTTESTAGAAVR